MSTSRSRAALENVDVAAATFIVGTDLMECDFLSVQDAIDNHPPEGADIYVLPGTYTQSAAITSVPVPISIRGSGVGVTILDFGTVAGKFFSIDHDSTINLKDLTVWAGGLAGQYLYDVSTNYLGTFFVYVSNVLVGDFLDATKSIEGGFLGSILGTISETSIIVQNTASSYFSDSGAATPATSFLVCYNVVCVGTGASRQKWGGFKNQAGVFADQSQFGCANFGSLGYTYATGGTSFIGGGTTSTLTVTSFSVFSGAYLNDVALVPSGHQCVVNGCISGVIYTLVDRIIDIPTGSFDISITGCVFASWAVETIRNDGTNVTISGCVGTGIDVLVTETANADNNHYWDIDAASTILGPSSRVDGVLRSDTTDEITTDAFVQVFEHKNSKGVIGIGTVKNIGALAATGSVRWVDPGRITSGQTITLDDGVNPATIFEIRKSGAASPGHVLVTIGLAPTPASAAAAFLAAVNGVGAGLAITASPGTLPEDVDLVNDATGDMGNVAITSTTAGATLILGMSGGADGGDMDVKESVTDAFGTSSSATNAVNSGADRLLNPQVNIGTARPPYVSYKVEVASTVAGVSTGYSLHHATEGAML